MEEDSIECITSSDGIDEDEIPAHHPHLNLHSQFSSSAIKAPHNINNLTNHQKGVVIHPSTSVHELLECPVCTNSMYPPIHQVSSLLNFCLWVFPSTFDFDFLPFLVANCHLHNLCKIDFLVRFLIFINILFHSRIFC